MESRAKGYRDLKVWQQAIDLVPRVYDLLKRFPKQETYALSDQVRRAVVSIPANIAEGQARQHRKEFVQHLHIAKGSLAELDTLLIVAHRLGYISAEQMQKMDEAMLDVRMPLQGLINRLQVR